MTGLAAGLAVYLGIGICFADWVVCRPTTPRHMPPGGITVLAFLWLPLTVTGTAVEIWKRM